MKLGFLLVQISLFLYSSSVFSETTQSGSFGAGEAEINRSCNISVKNSAYRVRSEPRTTKSNNCGGTLKSSGFRSVIAYGHSGKWIKIGHPSCPHRTAFVHRNAFDVSELKALASGQCAAMLSYGYRNAPTAPAANYKTTVANVKTNTSGHRFILDRCLGIRSDKHGSGHYHAPRTHGRHGGIDYKAAVGTPLKSPCVGKVTRSGYSGAAGNLMEIRCDNGDSFKLMHLKNSTPRMLKAGSRVGVGTTVGQVGKTGNANVHSMIPHIHIEYVKRGKGRVNPASLWNCK